MRILITGGCGFIGTRLTRALAEKHEVLCLDNLHPQVHGLFGRPEMAAAAKFIQGDVMLMADVERAVRYFDPEVIYHLAAETGTGQSYDEPTRYCNVNIIGTTNLVEAMRKAAKSARRVVLASSRSIYGEGACRNPEGTIVVAPPRDPDAMGRGEFGLRDEQGRLLEPVPTREDLPLYPASIYASTKLAQEHIFTQCFAGTPVEVAIVRLQNVYGAGQSLDNPYTGIISIFSKLLSRNAQLNIFEDGEIVRDFVYVGDVVRAFVMAGTTDKPLSGPLNIGSGSATTIHMLAHTLIKLFGGTAPSPRISGDFRIGDVRYAVGDIERARAELGWQPTTSLEEGLGEFVAWAREKVL